MKLKILLRIYLMTLFYTATVYGQPILNWNKVFDYNGHQDQPYQIIANDSGDIYVIGQTEITNNPQTNFDALILKYNRLGNLQWYRKHSLATSGDDVFIKALVTEVGNILVTGNMQVGSTTKILNILYSATGDTIWEDVQNYSGFWPYNVRNIFKDESRYYIVDAHYTIADSVNILVFSYKKSGEFIGVKFSENFYGAPIDLKFIESDSTLLLTYNDRPNLMQRRPLITKIKINGEKVWEKLLIDTTTSIEAIKTTIDDEGNIYTISNQRDFGNTVCYLTKLDKYGDLIWNRIFFFRDDYFASAIDLFINSTDQIRITGTYQYWDGNTTEYGTFTTSYDSSGNQIQFDQQQISLPIQFWATPKLDEADNIYIPLTVVAPSTYTDILIAKINSNDVLEYEKIYSHNNNPNITDDAAEIILFGEDNYAIVGREGGPVSPLNILVLRYGDNITSVVEDSKVLPYEFALSQNYPNPFNPSTKISWQSPVSSWQTLKIFDVLGNEVITLVNEYRNAGNYEINFDAGKLSSGVYYYQIRAGEYVQTKKMLLIK
ncbi:MAG TPA: hypothetical protein DHV28_11570 [Ignavibacteriales bacterium]|nr:hypothetical protein [Ignavibacteriales bacterium]